MRQLESAQRDYDSAVSRQKVGPASAGLLQTAQTKLDAINKLPPRSIAQVEKDAAQSEVGRLKGAVDTEKIDLQRLVDQTSNILKVAQDQLRRTEVRAPFDGILTAINFNDNAYVTINQALFTINSAATYVSGEVNEEDVGELRSGMKAEVRSVFLRHHDVRRHARGRPAQPGPQQLALRRHAPASTSRRTTCSSA